VVKTILCKRTIASIEFRKDKDLRRSEPRGDSGGSGWRKEAVKTMHNLVHLARVHEPLVKHEKKLGLRVCLQSCQVTEIQVFEIRN